MDKPVIMSPCWLIPSLIQPKDVFNPFQFSPKTETLVVLVTALQNAQ